MSTVRIDAEKVRRQARAALVGAMSQGGQWMVRRIKQSINIGNRDGSNPSAPGEPPHKRTALLFKSIDELTLVEGNTVVTKVGTPMKYGPHLEYGTSRMAARPFLRPALVQHRENFAKVVARALGRALNIGGG